MAKTTTEKKLPTHVDEVDALRYEKVMLQLQSLELQKQMLQAQSQGLLVEWNAKYSLSQEDQVDLQSREIKRADKSVPGDPEKK